MTVNAPTHRRPLAKLEATAWAIVSVLILWTYPSLSGHMTAASIVATLVAVASCVHVLVASGRRPSAGFIYIFLFSLFHVGILASIALNYDISSQVSTSTDWMTDDGMAFAAATVAVCQSALTAAYLLVVRSRFMRGDPRVAGPSATPAISCGWIGLGTLFAGLCLWLYSVLASGVSLVGASYQAFLSATSGSNIAFAYLLIGMGMGPLAASTTLHLRRTGLTAFALWSVPAFLMGLRGEVVIPLAVYLIVSNRVRPTVVRPWMAVPAVLFLGIGAAVKVIRQGGLLASTITSDLFSPLAGLTEMGATIRPLTYVQLLPQVGPDTYLNPFKRLILGRILGLDVPSARDDISSFSNFIKANSLTIGGSPVAEGYRAGGLFAAVVVMVVIAVALGVLDRLRSSPSVNTFVGGASITLLLWVRNDFTPVPLYLAIAVVVAVLVRATQDMGAPPAGARPVSRRLAPRPLGR